MTHDIDALRRHLLRATGAGTACAALAAVGLLTPLRVIAADWQRGAFTATGFNDALKAHGGSGSTESREIVFNAPEIAENGAQVVVEVINNLPGNQTISIFVEKIRCRSRQASAFANGALPQVRVPLKMAETPRTRRRENGRRQVVARAAGNQR